MARRTHLPGAASPLALWWDLALKTGEMLSASSRVIHTRTNRMVRAGQTGLPLSPRDTQEFTRMGVEKLEAAAASSQAMWLHWMQAQQQWAMKSWSQMLTPAFNPWTLMNAPKTGALMTSPMTLARSMGQAAANATQLSSSTARLLSKGLQPVHSRATANDRRLAAKPSTRSRKKRPA